MLQLTPILGAILAAPAQVNICETAVIAETQPADAGSCNIPQGRRVDIWSPIQEGEYTPACEEAMRFGAYILESNDLPIVMIRGMKIEFSKKMAACRESYTPESPLPRGEAKTMWDE